MGIFDDVFGFVGDTVGVVFGIAVAPIALALGVSKTLVKRAIEAGCRTEREIAEWIEDNT